LVSVLFIFSTLSSKLLFIRYYIYSYLLYSYFVHTHLDGLHGLSLDMT